MPKIPKINIENVAKITSKLQNSKSVLPVLLVEGAVIAGRSYQGYKRGGKAELNERLFEETATAAVWLGGVKALNKFGDFLGDKVLKLDKLNHDVGRDALRNPAAGMSRGTAIFKFSKIAMSVALTTAFVGFILPKIKQNMTKKRLAQESAAGAQKPQRQEIDRWRKAGARVSQHGGDEPAGLAKPLIGDVRVCSFLQTPQEQKAPALSFKGGTGAPLWLTSLSHNLENHNVYRLLATDGGIITGRVQSSRNEHEAREYLVRDILSEYFYLLALPNAMWALNKASKTAKINPLATLETSKHLSAKMGDAKFNIKDFSKHLLDKTTSGTVPEHLFKNDVVKLDALKNILQPEAFEKAAKMAQLQPELMGERVLSKMQLRDVLSGNWLSDPEFLRKITKTATEGLSENKTKFVSKKEVEKIRTSLDDFATNMVEYARKKGVEQVDANFVEKFAKTNVKKAAGFTIAGLAFSIFGLAWLVPKIQQFVTYKVTGKKTFPGVEQYDETQS